MGVLITQAANAIFGWLTAWLNSVIVDVLTQLFGGSV